MRINEIWKCEDRTPEETMQIIVNEHDGDNHNFEKITLSSFEEHWNNQDRFSIDNIDLKEKLRQRIIDGEPWYWFTVHC